MNKLLSPVAIDDSLTEQRDTSLLSSQGSCHADALAVDAEESRSRLRLLVVAKEVQTWGIHHGN